jgi:hypothetical protein
VAACASICFGSGGSGASELRGENRGTAGGGEGLGGCHPVHAKLGVCGAAELRVAVGLDIGKLVDDGKDVRNSALIVRRRQLTRVELLVPSQAG